MSEFDKVTHVIFDCDGLFLDSERIYEDIFNEITSKHGKSLSWDIKVKILGTNEWDSARVLIQELDLPITPEELVESMHSLEREKLPEVTLMPGVEKLMKHLKKHDIPTAMATSSTLESVELKSSNHKELFDLLHHVVSATSDPEVKRGKPSPDIFNVCASRFSKKPRPSECLVFEDAPNGVLAARSAEMHVVMVPDDRVSEKDRSLATLVLSSLEDFKPEVFGLPAFE